MNLAKFESLVYRHRQGEAARELLTMLDRLFIVMDAVPPPEGYADIPVLKSYTRFASAIAALIADPDFNLSGEEYTRLALRHTQLHSVFQASAFGAPDYLFDLIGEPVGPNASQRLYSTPGEVMKLLLGYSLDSQRDLDLEYAFRQWPALGLPIYLSMLSALCVVSPQAHQRRERLFDMISLFQGAVLSGDMVDVVCRAWMHCSYAHHPRKHGFKRWLNTLLEQALGQVAAQLPALPATRTKVERPVMVVIVEIFTSTHSMHRCYAPWMRQLRRRFRLILAGRSDLIDERAKQLFDDVMEFNDPTSAADLARKVMALRPDIVYYLSVGMAEWAILLANLRLAPIQIASQGHPASTQSRHIDYFLVSEDVSGDVSCYSERLVLTPKGSMRFEGRPDAMPVPPAIEAQPEVLRVAVPAMLCKLTAPFLAVCQRLLERSGRPLEFHFFPHMNGIYFHQARIQIKQSIPNAVVYAPLPYNEYIQKLGRCHLHLSPFPFGGMNSNIDSMQQGLPLVTLEGVEPHACMDAWMMRVAGMPEALIAHSLSEYEEVALDLISNDARRVELSQRLINTDLVSAFFRSASEADATDVSDIVWWLYQDHETIMADPRRVWRGREQPERGTASGARKDPEAFTTSD
jgi:hypothetical protein